jgi:hypothetical protein
MTSLPGLHRRAAAELPQFPGSFPEADPHAQRRVSIRVMGYLFPTPAVGLPQRRSLSTYSVVLLRKGVRTP